VKIKSGGCKLPPPKAIRVNYMNINEDKSKIIFINNKKIMFEMAKN
jgi:hypothetical protein